MKCEPFIWTQPLCDAQDGRCLSIWNGLELWARPDGQWWVAVGDWLLISEMDQTHGAELHDAMRRAQGAALIIRLT